jgi:choline dehydrogenase-like flavoprotein
MTDTFDFVVVGGGSGGCAVASRLSEDPNTSVALLEAGSKDDNWVVTTPGAMILMISGKVNNWAFDTVPQAGLQGRIGYQPRGKGLGGSSRDQCHGLHPRPPQRLRSVGIAWQCRLVLCRCAALLQTLGG